MVPVVLLQLYDAQSGNLPSSGSEHHVQHTVHTYSAYLQCIPTVHTYSAYLQCIPTVHPYRVIPGQPQRRLTNAHNSSIVTE
jgi:hypothetical protein